MKLEDKVKYYFRLYLHQVEIHSGKIFYIGNSSIFKNKKRYGIIDDVSKFQDFGYEKDFTLQKNG